MTDEQNKLIAAAQEITGQMNGLTFPEAIVVFGAVSDAITGGQSREASIAKTKMEEAILWIMRASDVRRVQEGIAKEAVELSAPKSRKSKKNKSA